jgi:hypothetical protein
MRLPHLYFCFILVGITVPGFSRAQGMAPDYATILRALETHPGQLRSVSAKYTRVHAISGS